MEEHIEPALVTVEAIEKNLDEASVQTSRLLRDFDTRIVLEDTLVLLNGKPTSGSVELESATHELAHQMGRL